jgi:hypothetical protein
VRVTLETTRVRALDLQELVERHDSFDRIPPGAWAIFDKAASRYRTAKIVKLRDEQERNRNTGKQKS